MHTRLIVTLLLAPLLIGQQQSGSQLFFNYIALHLKPALGGLPEGGE